MAGSSELTAAWWILESLALLGLAAIWICTRLQWPGLPARIPFSFVLAGESDSWGRRGWFILMPAAATVTYMVMSWAGGTHLLISGQAGESTTGFLICWAKSLTVMLMLYCVWTQARVARGMAERANIFVLLGGVALIVWPFVAGLGKP